MKITIENIGVFKYAEYELADLTIICGKNNTRMLHMHFMVLLTSLEEATILKFLMLIFQHCSRKEHCRCR